MKKTLVFLTVLSGLMISIESIYGQVNSELQTADSFYQNKNWTVAKQKYQKYLGDDSLNSLVWNRLGYCNQNLGNYTDAIGNYNRSLKLNPSPLVKGSAQMRLAMIYSILNNLKEASDWLMKATASGYNSLSDLDSLPAFSNLRASPNFREIRQNIYESVYPCSREPRNRDFDFWIGDWNVYRTGTQFLSGYSHVESMAGGCAILENYTSVQAYTGKSFNFYDTIAKKWEQDWIGSSGPVDRQRFYEGEFKNGAMRFTFTSTNPGGEKIKGNFIFYFISKDSVRQYQDVIDDNGKTISVTYDLTYLRKK
jgi:tetratricopeptide (TPR) repeat protein